MLAEEVIKRKINVKDEDNAFWSGLLSDKEWVNAGISGSAKQEFAYNNFSFSFPKELTDRINAVSKGNGAATYAILAAGVSVALSRYSESENLVFGTPVFQKDYDTNLLNKLLIFPFQITSDLSFKVHLSSVRNTLLQIQSHQNHPYQKLFDIHGIERVSNEAYFKAILHSEAMQSLEYAEECDCELLISFNSSLEMVLRSSDQIMEASIIRFKDQLVEILSKGLGNVNLQLDELYLPEAEIKQILHLSNNEANYPESETIISLFEKQVDSKPENIAIVFDDKKLTYKELSEKVNALASAIIEKGAKHEDIIAIITGRTDEMIIGMLGILKAGCAYLPIDPDYPQERIDFMLEDSQAKLVIVDSCSLLVDSKIETIDLKSLFLSNSSPRATNNQQPTTKSLAYIIYTSGSTGKPKGVMIEHRNVVRLLFNNKNLFNFNQNDTWTMFHSYCFDFSVWEMYGALLNGGKLVIVPKDTAKDPKEFSDLLRKEKVTVLNQTPGSFYNIINEERARSNTDLNLRYVIFGGEALQPIMLKEWMKKYPAVKLVNMYGITETTVHVTYKEITEREIEAGVSNIGTAIPTLSMFILDKNQRLVPIGVPGEICVGGLGLARGYLNRPELTKEKFIDHPLASTSSATANTKLYRSGDLGRLLENGEVEYLGRIDHQVKIRGHRIELGEIESAILKLQGIKEAVVIDKTDKEGNRYLVAYMTEKDPSTPLRVTNVLLRNHLSVSLPDYMIPAHFVILEKMPLTNNGKVDRKALPEHKSLDDVNDFSQPSNEKESAIVEVWKEVLGLEKLSANANFFSVGGDSIKAIQVSSRLYKRGYKVEIKEIFKFPVIDQLALYLKPIETISHQGIEEGEVELTPIQHWFFENDFTNTHHWNQAIMLFSKEPIVEKGIEAVLQKLVEHHDVLRMAFRVEGDNVKQINRPLRHSELVSESKETLKQVQGDAFSFRTYDFRSEQNPEKLIEENVSTIQESLNLEKGPLLSVGLYKTITGDHLQIVIHHLVVDGVSWRILLEDLRIGYQQFLKDENILFQGKTTSFRNWSSKQKQYSSTETAKSELKYWLDIESKPVSEIPFHTSASNLIKDGVSVAINLDEIYTGKLLKEVHSAYHTEINDVLLTALSYALKDFTKGDKHLINLEGHGREQIIDDVDISRTVGWFTTAYPVVIEVQSDKDLSFNIRSQKEMLKSIPNKGIGYGILKYLSGFKNELKRKPQISFNYLGQFDVDTNKGGFVPSTISTGSPVSQNSSRTYLIDINAIVSAGKLYINLNYNRNEFAEERMLNFLADFKKHLILIIDHCISKENTTNTPSDFTYSNLSMQQLSELEDDLGDLL